MYTQTSLWSAYSVWTFSFITTSSSLSKLASIDDALEYYIDWRNIVTFVTANSSLSYWSIVALLEKPRNCKNLILLVDLEQSQSLTLENLDIYWEARRETKICYSL